MRQKEEALAALRSLCSKAATEHMFDAEEKILTDFIEERISPTISEDDAFTRGYDEGYSVGYSDAEAMDEDDDEDGD